MSKIELDDMILEHPKFIRAVKIAGSDAIFLWLGLRAYCARMLTDGFVPFDMIEEVRGPRDASSRSAALQALTDSGLLDEAECGVVLHDYLDWSPSRAQILAWRKANADRKARSRARVTGGVTAESRRDIGNVTVGVTRESHCSHGGSHTGVPAPSPSPSPPPSFRSTTTTIQDLPDLARTHERPAPRVVVAGVESESTPGGQIDTETRVQTEPAQREPRKAIPSLESQREAQLSRRDRQRSEFSNMPIGELAKAWRLNPTWVSESEPQRRPEVAEVALAWDRAVGLRPTPLGHAARDPCVKAILELYADGVRKATLLSVCAQAGNTDWICGRAPDRNGTKKKRRISSLSLGVFRALLDAESDASTHQVSPAVAALLAERKEAV